MQNNQDVIKRAKRKVRRYRLLATIMVICYGLLVAVTIFFTNIYVGTLVAVLLMISMRKISAALVDKCLFSVLTTHLDSETFYAIVRHGKFDGSAASCQIGAEYSCGNYQKVVSICKQKLADPKLKDVWLYFYLTHLARVYFDIGDEENLNKIVEQYRFSIVRSKTRVRKYVHKNFSFLAFCDSYQKQDMDACVVWTNKTAESLLKQYGYTFCKARLALVQGKVEEARGYYEALAKEIPQLSWGKLAKKYLAEMDGQDTNGEFDTFAVSDEVTEVTLYPANRAKRVLTLVACFLCALVLSFLLSVAQYMKQQRDDIVDWVEQDYDGVRLLDSFYLVKGKVIIDGMFLCETDEGVVIGCVYFQDGSDVRHCRRMADVPIATLQEDNTPFWYEAFCAVTSDYWIESYFYKDKADLPAEYYHMSTLEIDGQKVYYVITDVLHLNKKFDRELTGYHDRILSLLEKDYDNVELLDYAFLRMDNEYVEALFVCKTDEILMFGSLYQEDGSGVELDYVVNTEIPIASLSWDQSPILQESFVTWVAYVVVDVCFYTDRTQVPTENYRVSHFDINGQKVYYAVTKISTMEEFAEWNRGNIRTLVKPYYGDVEVLNYFTALYGGIDGSQTVFVCKTDTHIIVGCVPDGYEKMWQYEPHLADIPIADLFEGESSVLSVSLPSSISDHTIVYWFSTVEDDLPTPFGADKVFEINGQKVYVYYKVAVRPD